jgi:F0F1-type ATP synthase assembly protein I
LHANPGALRRPYICLISVSNDHRPDNGLVMTEDKRALVAQYAAAGDAVVGIAVLSGLGAWGGFWLDGKLNSTPWCAIAFSLIGMTLGLTRMVLRALKQDRDSPMPSGLKPLPDDREDDN